MPFVKSKLRMLRSTQVAKAANIEKDSLEGKIVDMKYYTTEAHQEIINRMLEIKKKLEDEY